MVVQLHGSEMWRWLEERVALPVIKLGENASSLSKSVPQCKQKILTRELICLVKSFLHILNE